MSSRTEADILIIGAGITGMAVAHICHQANPALSILLVDKEENEAFHASGRNSGVLHAGFYYSASSLKAKFCREGNAAWKLFCKENALPLNQNGKLVVAKSAAEVEPLKELVKRGKTNGVDVELISAHEAGKYEPAAFTHEYALYSPTTATLNPVETCRTLCKNLKASGIRFLFETSYLGHDGTLIKTDKENISARLVVNCAGAYADRIAADYGFAKHYMMLPFKGLYLPYVKNKTDIRMNIYPVPDLRMPFLGVHFTITADNIIKVGPTATPAFWRENYKGLDRFSLREMAEVCMEEARLFIFNECNFRNLAIEEIKKYSRNYLIAESRKLAPAIDPDGFGEFTKPGIRAQLLDKRERTLVQDFLVEGDKKSVHVLNAVSPAFTCAFPFAGYIYDQFIKPALG